MYSLIDTIGDVPLVIPTQALPTQIITVTLVDITLDQGTIKMPNLSNSKVPTSHELSPANS